MMVFQVRLFAILIIESIVHPKATQLFLQGVRAEASPNHLITHNFRFLYQILRPTW